MNIDIDALVKSGLVVYAIGQTIVLIVKYGEHGQWKRDIDKKIEEMIVSIQKLNEIHTLEKLNSQQLGQIREELKEHKESTGKGFSDLNVKIDSMVSRVVETLGKLAEK